MSQDQLQQDHGANAMLFERLPIGAYRSSPDGRQLRANPALVRLNGYANEAELLAAVADIGVEWYVDPTRRALFRQLIERDGEVINFESEVLRHNTRHGSAERLWVRENAYLVRDPTGQVLWFEGTVEDITAEHQARQTAKDTLNRLRALTDNAQALTVVCDAQANVRYASTAARRLLGCAPEALVGSSVYDWLHPDDVARAHLEIAEVVQRCHPGVESINRVRHADGSWRLLASLGNNCLDDPAVQGLVLNFRDVTEAEHALQALRLSQQKFASAFAASPDCLVIGRLRDGMFLEVNERFVQLSGYSRAALIGRTSLDLQFWRSPDERAAFVAQFTRHGRVRDFVAAYQGAPGHQGVLSISAEPIEVDGQACLLSIARDITASLATQTALHSSEARLRLALQAANQGLFDVDLATGDAVVSPEYVRMLGHDPAQFKETTASWLARLHPDDHDPVARTIAAYVAGELPEYQVEFRQRTASGAWVWLLSVGRIIEPTQPGQHRRMLGTHTDITRRKLAETELLRQMQQLQAAERQAGLGLWEVDRATGQGWWSAQMYALLGLDPAGGFPSLPVFLNCLHPQDRDLAMALLEPPPPTGQGLSGHTAVGVLRTDPALAPQRWLQVSVQQQRTGTDAGTSGHRSVGSMLDITSIKQAERSIRDSELRYRRLVNQAPYAICLHQAGRFVFLNPTALALFGAADEAELIARPVLDRCVADDLAADLQAPAWQAVDGPDAAASPTWRAVRCLRLDGVIVEVEATSIAVLHDGQPAVQTVLFDVGPRKRDERALARQLARLERAETIAQLGSWDLDLTSRTVWWSPQMYRMTGVAVAEGPRAGLSHLHRDDRAAATAVIDRAVALGTPQQVLVRSNPALGPQRWFSAGGQVERGADGQALRLTGTLLDITALKQAEQALRQLNRDLEQRVGERTRQLADSERRYRRIFETVPVAILQEDWSAAVSLLAPLQGLAAAVQQAHLVANPGLVAQCVNSINVLSMNPAARQLYGVPADLPADPPVLPNLGTLFDQFGGPAEFVDELLSLLAGGRQYTVTRALQRADGSRLDVLVSVAFAAPDEPGGTVLVSLVDITELNRLSQALDASLQQAQRTNVALETFTYTVSHDLKAPLRGLDGYSQLLLRHHAAKLDDEGQLFLNNIRNAARQMGQLIDDLLAYSRLERRPQELARLPVAPFVQQLLALHGAALAERGITPQLKLPDMQVRADPQGLTLALRNLLDNALKFTRLTDQPQITIGGHLTAHTAVIWLQDNGLGFDMKYHDRIFEIFQRLQRAEDYPGTGVGLAIVRKAMERMGGRAWGHSTPGQGATFYLELPRD